MFAVLIFLVGYTPSLMEGRCNTNINFTVYMRNGIHNIKSNDCLDRSVPILAVCML